MRIGTQLLAAMLASFGLAVATLVVTVIAAHEQAAAALTQAHAQDTSRQITSLLVLTQEYARHAEARAAQQWHQRRSAISTMLEASQATTLNAPLKELRAAARSLPELFQRLEEMRQTDDAFTAQRRELIMDQLLTSTQAMSDYADQWYQEASLLRRSAEHHFQLIAVAAPLSMLLILLVLIAMIRQRVLQPLQTLDKATSAIAAGDFSVRIAGHTDDEFGQVRHRFDSMTAALEASREQLARSERQLRAIADNLPVLISYVDASETFRYTNAYYRTVYQAEPESFLGHTMESKLGEQAYGVLRPEIQRALRGEHRTFERHATERGLDSHFLVDYVPDAESDGKVNGFYVMVLDITARKKAELAQAQSERLLRLIADNLPTLIAYLDREGRFRFANAHYKRLLGVDPDSLLGLTVSEGLGRINGDAAGPYIQRALAGESCRFERQVVVAEATLHLRSEYLPDRTEDGSIQGLFAMAVDITDRRQAEDQLRRSERRLRDITNNIPAMVGYFDEKERCLFANSTVLKIHGIAEENTMQHTLRSGIGEEIYALHAPHVQLVLAGESSHFEGHVKRNGRDAHFQAHMVPDKGPDGSVKGFYVMTFDVTAVRRAELARARSEQRLRQITDNLPVLISYIDKDQKLTFANATYQEWLGVDPQAVVGLHIRDVVGSDRYESRRERLEQALAGERVEFEGEVPDLPSARTTHTCYIPDVDADGNVQGVYAMSSDVTALKEVERQLQSLARVDTLTGLANRLQFNERMPEALRRAARNRACLALLFLDVDNFKAINDSFGHAAGDAILQEFSRRLVDSVRKTDTVARLAGDEFVVILEGLHGAGETAEVARKILGNINQPIQIGDMTHRVTTSIGIAHVADAKRVSTPADLLSRADGALYAAKAAGRNTFELVEA